jgi:HAD superfamily 5'-nucleotidase-like hydrolase
MEGPPPSHVKGSSPSPSSSSSSFCLTDYDWIGFDLDHTLIRYHIDNLNELCYRCMVHYLVKVAHYPQELERVPLNEHFIKRGVVVDKKRGNILKLDEEGKVCVGFHGTKPLSPEQIRSAYYSEFPEGEQILEYGSFDGKRGYHGATTFFGTAWIWLFAILVDLEDEKASIDHRNYAAHADMMLNAFSYNFAEWNKGYYYPELVQHPEKYIYHQPKVKQWLKDLREKHGVKLFLLTNSLPEYLELLAKFAYGDDWKDLFDFIIVNGRKPFFFTSTDDFFECIYHEDGEIRVSDEPAQEIDFTKIYSVGNYQKFVETIKRTSKNPHTSPRVLYFGDHPQYDVLAPKTASAWETVAIIEELEDLEREAGKEFPDLDPSFSPNYRSGHKSHHELWGSFFYVSHKETHLHSSAEQSNTEPGRRKYTFWARHYTKYSSLYVPSVNRLAHWPCDHVFKANECSVLL